MYRTSSYDIIVDDTREIDYTWNGTKAGSLDWSCTELTTEDLHKKISQKADSKAPVLSIGSVPITKFRLWNNKIKDFPDLSLNEKYFSHLQWLNLNENEITEIPKKIEGYDIKELWVEDNKIEEIHALPSSIKHLRLKGNPLKVIHKDCFQSEAMYDVLRRALTSDQVSQLQQPTPQAFRAGYYSIKQYFGSD